MNGSKTIQELYNQKLQELAGFLTEREATGFDNQPLRDRLHSQALQAQRSCALIAQCLAVFGNSLITPESIEYMRSRARDIVCLPANDWLQGILQMEQCLDEAESGEQPVDDELFGYAAKVFGNKTLAALWFSRHNTVLDEIPGALLKTPEGVQRVRTILSKIEHGSSV